MDDESTAKKTFRNHVICHQEDHFLSHNINSVGNQYGILFFIYFGLHKNPTYILFRAPKKVEAGRLALKRLACKIVYIDLTQEFQLPLLKYREFRNEMIQFRHFQLNIFQK